MSSSPSSYQSPPRFPFSRSTSSSPPSTSATERHHHDPNNNNNHDPQQHKQHSQPSTSHSHHDEIFNSDEVSLTSNHCTHSPTSTPINDLQLETPLLLGIDDYDDDQTVESINRRRQQQRPWFGEGSIKSSIFNLTNATLGAGIVSVPFAMMSLGLGLGMLTITLLAIASTTATKALVTVLNHTSANSFEGIATIAGGRRFSLLVQLVLVLFNFGSAIGYLICISDIFSVIVHAYGLDAFLPVTLQWILHRHLFLIAITLIVLLPLCLVDKLSKLRMASLLGLVALELLVIVSFVLLFQKGVHKSLGPFPYVRAFSPKGVKGPLRGIPLLVFAFSCHSNAPSIYSELENQSYRRMAKVSRRSVITAFITYTVMGICGFFIFGYSVASNVLTNFTSDLRNSTLLVIAFIGILIGVILSFPMNIFPCKSSVELALFPDGVVTSTQSTMISIGLVVASLAIALIIPSLAILFSLTGSVCGSCVAFIFPGIFVLKLLPGPLSDSRKIKALILLVSGMFIAVFGTAVSITEIIHPPPRMSP